MALYGYKVPKGHEREPVKTQWLSGPLMEFYYEEDGKLIQRQGHLGDMYQEGVYWVIAADEPELMPRHFFLNAHFPWHHFKPWILEAWSRDPYLPFCFKPLKRIPDEIIENLKLLSDEQFEKVLATLRQQGFLPQLRKLNSKLKFKPGNLSWDEIKSYCFQARKATS